MMAGSDADGGAQADAALAARAREGDRDAFGQLVERHYEFIFRVAYRWLADEADAEDVAQEVCIKLSRAIRGYAGRAAFSTWLYRLTLNGARDFSRGRSRETRRNQEFAREAQVLEQDSQVPVEEQSTALWDAVRALPEKQRDSVLLVYGEGLSHGNAADILDCAESTVSWHIHAAKKRLKDVLRHAEEEL